MQSMPRKRDPRERVLGPYPHHGGWRVVLVRADGRRRYSQFAERASADGYVAILQRKISTIVYTTDTARQKFVEALKTRNLSPRTIEGYEWAVKTMWPSTRALSGLSRDNCAERYAELQRMLSVDSHRNALKMCKTFLRWCVEQGWIGASPMDGLAGVGNRKKGKPQLRLDETRRFYAHVLERANGGDEGAVAALMALLLTMRSGCEILSTKVRDLDDGGRLLVIEQSKTEAGSRRVRVPEELRPALLRLARGKGPTDRLFRRRDRKWVWDEVQRLCDEAGVPRVPPHGLRGGGATTARISETPEAIAALLGHADVRVTEEHYIDKDAAQAADQDRRLRLLRGGRGG